MVASSLVRAVHRELGTGGQQLISDFWPQWLNPSWCVRLSHCVSVFQLPPQDSSYTADDRTGGRAVR
ncbi:hypothetical protein [Streptomyces guryensis]|uniref:Uncharacterized protein n=1 Tax=Streptomyces guryensis TaxID=2886947 RepID=A0A9Q3Z5Z2_9ACTN|nr:hypothetical protein [Streptomyces guryensis]MCD9872862.1 hypothetical protein [Streptomyces guryensis]